MLSSDPAVGELTMTMARLAEIMSGVLGRDVPKTTKQMMKDLKDRGLGVLRSGEEFKLATLTESAPSADLFKLPAEPMKMPNMGNMFGTMGASNAANDGGSLSDQPKSDSKNNPVGSFLGKKTERQKNRVEGKVESKVDKKTDKVIDKAVDKVFDKFFGK